MLDDKNLLFNLDQREKARQRGERNICIAITIVCVALIVLIWP